MSSKRIATLRYDKTLLEPMLWVYDTYGDEVYSDLKIHEEEILNWCEQNELDLNAKKRKALVNIAVWQKHLKLLQTAQTLQQAIGNKEFIDFNLFKKKVDVELKAKKIKISASEKNTIFSAISWYDAEVEKVIKKKREVNG